MDAKASHYLVCLPPEQKSLVPASVALVPDGHDHREPNPFDLLWRCFCKLAGLFFLALVVLRRLRLQLIELRLQANYYRSQHQRAVQREAALKEQVEILQGEIRELKRRIFGRKSETSSATKPTFPANNRKKRSRGQQRGGKGHGRRRHEHLPTIPENVALPKDQQCCAACGEPFSEIPGTADGDILEIEVRAHRRRYHRQRYRRH